MSRRPLRIIENNGDSPWIVGFVLVVVVATILLRAVLYPSGGTLLPCSRP
ncbi:MAG TPA: hypothetical protein VHJ58_12760 [Vicinamibacterales bacterium]|jgi:hypothetical protein|nr:hypothetical protein [Vicinamibacterales bacterium]